MTRVKICGITRPADAQQAADLGAWAVGLVRWTPSPRCCPDAAAERIGAALHRRCEVAGVYFNSTLDEIALDADRFGLTLLQLHGDEGPAFCREAARRTGCKVMKAVRVRDASTVRGLGAFGTDFHLLDASVAGQPGGTGTTFAWELARHHRGHVPLVLSGGLTPANVAEGIALAEPWAVDVASGVEESPGIKDPAAVEGFFAAVAAADLERVVA